MPFSLLPRIRCEALTDLSASFLKEKGNKYLIYILVGLLALVILLPTEVSSHTVSQQEETIGGEELEIRLKKVLSQMEGVGAVEVMITTKTDSQSVFGEEEHPEVSGVVVVAEGADNPSVNAQITEAVKALFSIDVHKISIVKMRSVEGE